MASEPPEKGKKRGLLGKKGGGNWGRVDPGKSKLGLEPVPPPSAAGLSEPRTNQQPGRFHRGDIASMEVEKYQADGEYLLPRAAFWHLVLDIAKEVSSTEHRWEREAVDGLQAMSENFLEITFRSKFQFIQVCSVFYLYYSY